MKSWSWCLTHVAETDLAKLPKGDLQAVIRAVDKLVQNPSSVDIRKLTGYPACESENGEYVSRLWQRLTPFRF